MKSFIQVGERWFNPEQFSLIEIVDQKVKIHMSGGQERHYTVGTDEAEEFLGQIGWGLDARAAATKKKEDEIAARKAKMLAEEHARAAAEAQAAQVRHAA